MADVVSSEVRGRTRARRGVQVAIAFVLLASILTPSGRAQRCEVGLRPGSTLLFPYFEVDLSRADGRTTLLSINSASDAPTLARVILWTDWANPVLGFDLYLTDQDVQTINLRDVLSGNLPSTGGPGLLQFPLCATTPPSYGHPGLSPRDLAAVVGDLSYGGETGTSGPCVGSAREDRHAHGYVTVDTVGRCTGLSVGTGAWYGHSEGFPISPTYFTETAVTNDVLWGDLLYVDPGAGSAQGVEAVPLRSIPAGLHPHNTFYGRLVGWSGADRRSPLPTRWAVRFVGGGAFDGGTELVVFRDPRAPVNWEVCGRQPAWFPALADRISVRDEDSHVALTLRNGGAFPLATQRVSVKSFVPESLGVPFGRLDMSLRLPDGSPAGAWVMPIFTASGRYSVDFNAQPLEAGCDD